MLFPTTSFAFFFAAVLLLWWGVPGRWSLARKVILLAANVFFYCVWSWKFALLLLATAAVNHALARAAAGATPAGEHPQSALPTAPSKRGPKKEEAPPSLRGDAAERQGGVSRRWAILAVVLNLVLLGVFKYAGFLFSSVVSPIGAWFCRTPEATMAWMDFQMDRAFPLLSQIVLPIGISFTTFSAIAYVVDAARGTFRPAKSLLDFANYLAFFPKLCAGPIVRPADLLPALEDPSATALPKAAFSRATLLLVVGLLKKTVFANVLAQRLVDPFYGDPSAYGLADAALAAIGYSVQLYCDFSAYTDMAIGLALMLGFAFPHNFDAPYFSRSLQEFWRRWHITLSSWLRDYLYIPLGGSRRGVWRTYRNLFLTMLLGGLWHGAGWMFLLWGAIHGAGLAIERAIGKALGAAKNSPFRPGLLPTFLVVAIAWIPFRLGTGRVDAEGMAEVVRAFGRVSAAPTLATGTVLVALALGFLAQFADGDRLLPAARRLARLPAPLLGLVAALLLTLALGLGPRGIAPFIYFQF